ncbi:hypothetical protein [Actinomadura rifamycini]|uniref:hypothetical protein n=1 Tax=Actinomadura rifamycini TaxID=31962 RepID=UPI0003F9FA90|nr:hypothetical protein [Actinomadura rifamycini]
MCADRPDHPNDPSGAATDATPTIEEAADLVFEMREALFARLARAGGRGEHRALLGEVINEDAPLRDRLGEGVITRPTSW